MYPLRNLKQTIHTRGNSKRYMYTYQGVWREILNMIHGKIKCHLTVQIATLEILIQNWIHLKFVGGHKMIINSQNNIHLILKFLPSFYLNYVLLIKIILAYTYLILHDEKSIPKSPNEDKGVVTAWEQRMKDIKAGKDVAPLHTLKNKKKQLIPKSK